MHDFAIHSGCWPSAHIAAAHMRLSCARNKIEKCSKCSLDKLIARAQQSCVAKVLPARIDDHLGSVREIDLFDAVIRLPCERACLTNFKPSNASHFHRIIARAASKSHLTYHQRCGNVTLRVLLLRVVLVAFRLYFTCHPHKTKSNRLTLCARARASFPLLLLHTQWRFLKANRNNHTHTHIQLLPSYSVVGWLSNTSLNLQVSLCAPCYVFRMHLRWRESSVNAILKKNTSPAAFSFTRSNHSRCMCAHMFGAHERRRLHVDYTHFLLFEREQRCHKWRWGCCRAGEQARCCFPTLSPSRFSSYFASIMMHLMRTRAHRARRGEPHHIHENIMQASRERFFIFVCARMQSEECGGLHSNNTQKMERKKKHSRALHI